MSEERVERKLTTILAADVVGYSLLIGADEARTLAALKAHRKELIDPKAAQYGGHVTGGPTAANKTGRRQRWHIITRRSYPGWAGS